MVYFCIYKTDRMSSERSCYKTEKELIDACIQQDRRAQRELYDRFASRMFSVCYRYADDRDSANDLLQDGFITVFTKLRSYTGIGSFEGWMRKIFVNTALMQLRKNDVLRDTQDIEELKFNTPMVDNILDTIEGKDIMELISKMPIGFKTVFNLSVFDGYSHQEIAAQLNISEGASRSQLSRARFWLQERIVELNKIRK